MSEPLIVDNDGDPVNLRCSVLVLRSDSVLLCRRADRDDLWVLPGGTPRRGEGSAAAARREVAEETGLVITAKAIAFVLEATSWDRTEHRIEIVFYGTEEDPSQVPEQRESHLEPAFVALSDLDSLRLRPPIAGYIRGFARSSRSTAAYLGNLWRAESEAVDRAGPGL